MLLQIACDGCSSSLLSLGYISLSNNISPSTSAWIISIISDCIASIMRLDYWLLLLDYLTVSSGGFSRSNPSWYNLDRIVSIRSCLSGSGTSCHYWCCLSPRVLPQFWIPGSVSFWLDSYCFSFLIILSGWLLFPAFLFIGVRFALRGMPPLGERIFTPVSVWNCASSFTWNCGRTSPVFRDITRATLLEYTSDDTKHTPTLDWSEHLWRGCMDWSALPRKYTGNPKKFQCSELGPLGIMKILPVVYFFYFLLFSFDLATVPR